MWLGLLASAAWAGRPSSEHRVALPDRPVVCHSDVEADPHCDLVLAGIDEAWAVLVEELGFAVPLSDGEAGGGPELDVYLSSRGTGGAGGAYVICDGAESDPCVDVLAGDGLASTPSYIVIDPETPEVNLSAYARHEFAHVLQYATDFEEPFISFWEGVAVAAEGWTDPSAPVDPGPIADYQAAPWASVILQDGYHLDELYGLWSYYEYGAVLWVRWLDERHGDGAGAIGPALWSATANDPGVNEPDVLDAWASVGGDVSGDLVAFTRFRSKVGTAEGADWLGELPATTQLDCEGERTARAGESGEWAARHEVWPLGFACLSVTHETGLDVSFVDAGDFVLLDLDAPEDTPGEVSLRFEGAGTVRLALLRLPTEDFDADDVLTPVTPTLAWAADGRSCGCGAAPHRAALGFVAAAVFLAARRRSLRGGGRPQPVISKVHASQSSASPARGTKKPSIHGTAT